MPIRSALPARITAILADLPDADPLAARLRLHQKGLDQLPGPGAESGATLARWQALAAVGAHSVTRAKLYEGRLDAIAIVTEAGRADLAANGVRGTWCAEAPNACMHFDGATQTVTDEGWHAVGMAGSALHIATGARTHARARGEFGDYMLAVAAAAA
jgi:hypothetical protein